MTQEYITKLRGVFAVFSCVGFELNYERIKLHTTGAFHGATEAWDHARRNPNNVYGDIERRGDQWHVDVITRAYGNGRYDCWFASVYPSLEAAYRALTWLSEYDWKVLRAGPKGPSGSTVLTDEQCLDLEAFVQEGGAS